MMRLSRVGGGGKSGAIGGLSNIYIYILYIYIYMWMMGGGRGIWEEGEVGGR